jgi:hypothetical protein
VQSPKRSAKAQIGWEGFFPYYAGFPESFARSILSSVTLPSNAMILDPWNGSGTTTYVASSMGVTSIGLDLNPVMVLVARARLLPASEADSIEPLASEILGQAKTMVEPTEPQDPLRCWFGDNTASTVRSIERSIRQHLLGSLTLTPTVVRLDRASGLAATNYVALFSLCRALAALFKSSNPTWLRLPSKDESRIGVSRKIIERRFTSTLRSMAHALVARSGQAAAEFGSVDIRLTDTTKTALPSESVDLALTSPPYCTRIDYTAATRIELAVLHPLLNDSPRTLARRMMGSTRVPDHIITASPEWGPACLKFLDASRRHPTKASAGYYYQTHLDYFEKMSRSIRHLASAIRSGGSAIFVVQDSFYKDLHNDLATFISQMASHRGLRLSRRYDFHLRRSMSGINPGSRAYSRRPGATESVLRFDKMRINQ